jgi:hypothetical protein
MFFSSVYMDHIEFDLSPFCMFLLNLWFIILFFSLCISNSPSFSVPHNMLPFCLMESAKTLFFVIYKISIL